MMFAICACVAAACSVGVGTAMSDSVHTAPAQRMRACSDLSAVYEVARDAGEGGLRMIVLMRLAVEVKNEDN